MLEFSGDMGSTDVVFEGEEGGRERSVRGDRRR